MKFNKLSIGISLSFALVLSSCEKVIDVEPEFAIEGTQLFKNLDEYQYALTGAYALFRQTGYYGSGGQTTGSWSTLPDMMSDNLVQTGEDLANWQAQTNFVYAADDSDIEIAWQAAYYVINQANVVLNNIDQFAEIDAERVNEIKGQALAIRGMAHFDVLRYWGEDFDRNSSKLGIPYRTTPDPEAMPSRLTVKETYDNILKDLQDAETLLDGISLNSANNRAYIDQLAVQALLARVSLYAKDYAAAESYSTMVIDARPLVSINAFPGIWTDATAEEVIWAVSFSAGEGTPSGGVHVASSNRNRFRPAAPLVAAYDQVNDVRFPAYIGLRQSGNVSPPRTIYPGLPEVIGTNGSPITRTIVSKFIGRNGALDNVVNWKVLRTGEMYLIRAEASAQAGKEAMGLADLNALRAARINNYTNVTLSGQDLLNAIALERRKELFGEGHRWFDLKRTTRTLTRTDVVLGSTVLTLDPTAREWVWPIPQVEIDANASMASQQTTGY